MRERPLAGEDTRRLGGGKHRHETRAGNRPRAYNPARPPHVGDKLPRQTAFAGAEFKTYKLSVRLVGWKLSDNDSDIHLEVRGLFAPQTMVVEFPLTGCIAKSASATNRQMMARAKSALLKACGELHQPTTSMRKLTGTATITGVGRSRSGRGVAKGGTP